MRDDLGREPDREADGFGRRIAAGVRNDARVSARVADRDGIDGERRGRGTGDLVAVDQVFPVVSPLAGGICREVLMHGDAEFRGLAFACGRRDRFFLDESDEIRGDGFVRFDADRRFGGVGIGGFVAEVYGPVGKAVAGVGGGGDVDDVAERVGAGAAGLRRAGGGVGGGDSQFHVAFTFVGHAVVVAVFAGRAVDVAGVRDAVVVAVRIAVADAVEGAAGGGAAAFDFADVGRAVAVAVVSRDRRAEKEDAEAGGVGRCDMVACVDGCREGIEGLRARVESIHEHRCFVCDAEIGEGGGVVGNRDVDADGRRQLGRGCDCDGSAEEIGRDFGRRDIVEEAAAGSCVLHLRFAGGEHLGDRHVDARDDVTARAEIARFDVESAGCIARRGFGPCDDVAEQRFVVVLKEQLPEHGRVTDEGDAACGVVAGCCIDAADDGAGAVYENVGDVGGTREETVAGGRADGVYCAEGTGHDGMIGDGGGERAAVVAGELAEAERGEE